MYIGETTLTSIIKNDENIDWIEIFSINENRSEICLSNNEKFTINKSLEYIINIFKKFEDRYALPPLEDICYKFIAINHTNIQYIDDENIFFKDGLKYTDFYANTMILIDKYQLSFEYPY